MSYSITIKPPSGFDYANSIFDNLKIDIFEYEHSPPIIGVHKVHYLRDRRYNPLRRDWKLNELVADLEKLRDIGPLAPAKIEHHSSFEVRHQQPFEKFAEVTEHAVFLPGWQWEHVYRTGEFSSLEPALKAVNDAFTYLAGQHPDARGI